MNGERIESKERIKKLEKIVVRLYDIIKMHGFIRRVFIKNLISFFF